MRNMLVMALENNGKTQIVGEHDPDFPELCKLFPEADITEMTAFEMEYFKETCSSRGDTDSYIDFFEKKRAEAVA